MPNVAKVLKEEISRLSRKEARHVTAGLAKRNATLRSRVAALRKEVSGLKAEQKRLSSALSRVARNTGVESPKEEFLHDIPWGPGVEKEAEIVAGPVRGVAWGVQTNRVYEGAQGRPARVSRRERGGTAGRSNYRCCGSTRAVGEEGSPDQNEQEAGERQAAQSADVVRCANRKPGPGMRSMRRISADTQQMRVRRA